MTPAQQAKFAWVRSLGYIVHDWYMDQANNLRIIVRRKLQPGTLNLCVYPHGGHIDSRHMQTNGKHVRRHT